MAMNPLFYWKFPLTRRVPARLEAKSCIILDAGRSNLEIPASRKDKEPMDPNELSRTIVDRRAEQAARERRSPPDHVHIDSLVATVRDGARWRDEKAFPSHQKFSDEVEKVLAFAVAQDRFAAYLPRLRGRWNQFESALAELRVAFYLHRNQFRVQNWEPVGARGVPGEGEFSVAGPSGVLVFVEVKSPGWEGEVSEEERRSGRLKQPKNLYCEGRWVAPWQKVQSAVAKAYKKLRSDNPNLLIVADDFFVSLQHDTDMQVGAALYAARTEGCFSDRRYENLGGIGIFWIEQNDREIWYGMRLFLNPHASQRCSLPEDMRRAFFGKEATSPSNSTLAGADLASQVYGFSL